MKKGVRVKSKVNPKLLGTVQSVDNQSEHLPNTCMVLWDNDPVYRMFKTSSLDIVCSKENIRHFLVTVAVKVDIKNEGWTTPNIMDYGIQNTTRKKGYDGLTNKDKMGVTIVGYKQISEKKFEEYSTAFFSTQE